MRLACLIPARGGSKRLPRKNVALVNGRPALEYAVAAARDSGLFERISVSTEDAEIAAIARAAGAELHERAAALATDSATVVDTALDFIDAVEARQGTLEGICVILPTAVLLRSADLRAAHARFCVGDADTVMAVTSFIETPFQAMREVGGYLHPMFVSEFRRRSQELPALCVDSGYFYFSRIDVLRRHRTFYSDRLVGYRLPRDRSLDIDEPEHLRIAEALLQAAVEHQR